METLKKYWNISEVSEMIGVNKSCLRYWESQFNWINPKRNERNKRKDRKYVKADIAEFENINMINSKSKKDLILYINDLQSQIKTLKK